MNKARPKLMLMVHRIKTERASNLIIMGEVKIVKMPHAMYVVPCSIAISLADAPNSISISKSAGENAP